MNRVKDFYVTLTLIVCIVVRLFVTGSWVSSIVVLGLIISLFDLQRKLLKDSIPNFSIMHKDRVGRILLIIYAIMTLLFVIALVNIAIPIGFFNNQTVLDEITFITLILTLSQNSILYMLRKNINK